MIFENQVNLSEEQESFITWAQGPLLPWLFSESTSNDFMYFHHPLKLRTGEILSPYYDVCYSIFDKFMKENNLSYKSILRASINNTYHHPQKMNGIHLDHSDVSHGNFLMYMNTFTGGYTYLFNDQNELIHTIIPEKYKGVIFKNTKHAQGFCGPNENRFVLLFTYEI